MKLEESKSVESDPAGQNLITSLKILLPSICCKLSSNITLDTFILIVCICIEKITEKLTSDEKLNLVFEITPVVLDLLIELRLIDAQKKSVINDGFRNVASIFDKIKTYIFISNNPNLLNDKFTKKNKRFGCCCLLK